MPCSRNVLSRKIYIFSNKFYCQKSNDAKLIIAVHLIYNQIFSYGQLCSPPLMWHKLLLVTKSTASWNLKLDVGTVVVVVLLDLR